MDQKVPALVQGVTTMQGSNVTKLKDVQQAAADANRLVGDKLFKEALANIEKQYIDGMLMLDVNDDLGRHRFAEAIKVTRMISRHLQSVIGTGKLAKAELAELSGKKKRFF